MNLFKKLFGKTADTPMTLQAQPITVNPSNPAQLKRHAGRLATLYAAAARDPSRTDVQAEIALRRAAVASFGHYVPTNEDEARELLARLEQ